MPQVRYKSPPSISQAFESKNFPVAFAVVRAIYGITTRRFRPGTAFPTLDDRAQNRYASVAGVFVVGPILLLAFPEYTESALSVMWMFIASIVNFGMICLAWDIWDRVREATGSLDELLTSTPRQEREVIDLWLSRWLNWKKHLAVSLLGLGALISLIVEFNTHLLKLYPYSIATVLISGLLFGHSLYLIYFSVGMCRQLGRLSKVNVRWISPIDTPGLVKLSRVLRHEALLGAALLFVVAAPLIYVYVSDKSLWATALFGIGIALPVVSIVGVGLLSQAWLGKPIRREKERILAVLTPPMTNKTFDSETLGTLSKSSEVTRLQVELYRLVSESRDSFLSIDLVSVYLAAGISATVPLIATILINPSHP